MFCWRSFGHNPRARAPRTAAAAAVVIALVGWSAPARGDAGDPAQHVSSDTSKSSAPVADMTLARLLESMASVKGLSAKFREEKHMDLLAVPIVNEGELHFAPPGRLVRRTTAPAPSTVLISGDTLSFVDAAGREHIDLSTNPAVRMFVDSFVKIYAGDKEALERMYGMSFKASGAAWTLTLTPKLSPIDKVIRSIELTGEGPTLRSMRVVELGGDETVTRFSEVRAREFSEAELRALFTTTAPTSSSVTSPAPAGPASHG